VLCAGVWAVGLRRVRGRCTCALDDGFAAAWTIETACVPVIPEREGVASDVLHATLNPQPQPLSLPHPLTPKVHVLEGDLTMTGLGLTADDQATLIAEVTVIIHAASIIELEADVQRTLRGNYLGTKRLLLLAARMPQLGAMVALGSAHANVNLPAGSSVDERIYPLFLGSQEVGAGFVLVFVSVSVWGGGGGGAGEGWVVGGG